MSTPVQTLRFDPAMSFEEVRRRLDQLRDPAHRGLIARVTWLEGLSAGESLTYLWDPIAERFGHNIDKEPIDHEIVDNLINGISLEVQVLKPKNGAEK